MSFATHIHKIKITTPSVADAEIIASRLIVYGVKKFDYTWVDLVDLESGVLHKFTNISDEDLTVDQLREITSSGSKIQVETYSRKKGKDGW